MSGREVTQVVHHHHYYGSTGPVSAPRPTRPVPSRPVRAVGRGPGPAVYLLGGALAVVAVVVAVAVATAVLVAGGLALGVVVLAVREYVRMGRVVEPVSVGWRLVRR